MSFFDAPEPLPLFRDLLPLRLDGFVCFFVLSTDLPSFEEFADFLV
jgi:hypothetical protein